MKSLLIISCGLGFSIYCFWFLFKSYKSAKEIDDRHSKIARTPEGKAGEVIATIETDNFSIESLGRWARYRKFDILQSSYSKSTYLVNIKLLQQPLVIYLEINNSVINFYSWTVFGGRHPILYLPKQNLRRRLSLKCIKEITQILSG